MPEVFVSHSSHEERGRKVRDAVVAALKAVNQYEVFWD